jgi:class 3 adenylate cyclase
MILEKKLGDRPEANSQSVLKKRTYDLLLKDSVYRARLLCLFFSAVTLAYGFTSFEFIKRFKTDVTLWGNFWPRILFNALPLILLVYFTSNFKLSDRKQLFLSITVLSLVIHIGAWIYVWPIALHGTPVILSYVNSANIYFFAFVNAFVSPPTADLFFFITIQFMLFVCPLFIVAFVAGDPVIFKLVLNDSLFALGTGILVSRVIQGLRAKVAALEWERAKEAGKFLGETVSKAIFEDRLELLERRTSTGFLLCTDVRGFTGLVRNFPKEQVTQFMDRYFEILNQAVGKYGGVVHKTAGDGHLISFGLMDHFPDLKIEGIVDDERKARLNRQTNLAINSLRCFDEIVWLSTRAAEKSGLTGLLRISAALDYGEIEIKVVGDSQYRKELDIYGATVIRCSRLQGHTKAIETNFNSEASLLIISPTANDYFLHKNDFTKISTGLKPVRDFPEIKELFVYHVVNDDFQRAKASNSR